MCQAGAGHERHHTAEYPPPEMGREGPLGQASEQACVGERGEEEKQNRLLTVERGTAGDARVALKRLS